MELLQPSEDWEEDDNQQGEHESTTSCEIMIDQQRSSNAPAPTNTLQDLVWRPSRSYDATLMPEEDDHQQREKNHQTNIRYSGTYLKSRSNESPPYSIDPPLRNHWSGKSTWRANHSTSVESRGKEMWDRGTKLIPTHQEREIIWLPEWQQEMKPMDCVLHQDCNLCGAGFLHPGLIICRQNETGEDGKPTDFFVVAQVSNL